MKTPAVLGRDIETLRAAVAHLHFAGIEILSAEVRAHREPTIHIAEPNQELLEQPGCYVRALLDRQVHYAILYHHCEVVWIEPFLPASPGASDPTLDERIASHG